MNVLPNVVRLTGYLSQQTYSNIEMRVKITPVSKYPFSIKSFRLADATNIIVQIVPSKFPAESWDIIVKNIRKKTGRYFDEIIIETDSKIVPEIKINVFGNIMD